MRVKIRDNCFMKNEGAIQVYPSKFENNAKVSITEILLLPNLDFPYYYKYQFLYKYKNRESYEHPHLSLGRFLNNKFSKTIFM